MSGNGWVGKHKNELGTAAALAAAAAAIYFTGGAATPAVAAAAEGAAGAGAGAAAGGSALAAEAGAGSVGAGSLLASEAGAGGLAAGEAASAGGLLSAGIPLAEYAGMPLATSADTVGLLGYPSNLVPDAVATGFDVGGPGIGYAEEMGSGGPTTLADQAGTMWGNFSRGGGSEKFSKYAKLADVTNGLLNQPQPQAPPMRAPQRPQLAPPKLPPLYQDDTEEKRRQYQQWLAMQQGRGFYG